MPKRLCVNCQQFVLRRSPKVTMLDLAISQGTGNLPTVVNEQFVVSANQPVQVVVIVLDGLPAVNHSYKPVGDRHPGGQVGKARDFLNRVERFGDKRNVLRSLPDRGQLFNTYFNVEVSEAAKRLSATTPKPPAVKFRDNVAKILPGWSVMGCASDSENCYGRRENYRGRQNVLRTHPIVQETPCILERRMDIPANKKTILTAVVSNHPNSDWEFVGRVNGAVQKTRLISNTLSKGSWVQVTLDLTPFAGKKDVLIELENKANDWSFENAYWASISVESK